VVTRPLMERSEDLAAGWIIETMQVIKFISIITGTLWTSPPYHEIPTPARFVRLRLFSNNGSFSGSWYLQDSLRQCRFGDPQLLKGFHDTSALRPNPFEPGYQYTDLLSF
jgi:hypothetical protein